MSALVTSVATTTSTTSTITYPKNLGIYYGWPLSVTGPNGERSIESAVDAFSKYDILVLAGSLARTDHGAHEDTKKIIAHPGMSKTDVYGYVSTKETPQEAIKQINQWVDMGNIAGIFLDEYGYDYKNPKTGKYNNRQHQNFILYYIHNSYQKDTNVPLRAFVNAWNQHDVFADEPNTGIKHTLNPDDWTLWESYQIKRGEYVEERNANKTGWRDKADILKQYKGLSNVAAVTTTFAEEEEQGNVATDYDIKKFNYAYVSSILDGIHAFGWGEKHYGSRGGLPWRPRPKAEKAEHIDSGGELVKIGNTYQRGSGPSSGYLVSVNVETREVVLRE